MRRCNYDAIRGEAAIRPIPAQNGAGNYRSRCKTIITLDESLDPIRRQHFYARCVRAGSGKVRGCLCPEQRTRDSLVAAVFADRLGDRENMRFGKRRIQAGAAMPTRAKANELIWVVRIGFCLVEGCFELGHMDSEGLSVRVYLLADVCS